MSLFNWRLSFRFTKTAICVQCILQPIFISWSLLRVEAFETRNLGSSPLNSPLNDGPHEKNGSANFFPAVQEQAFTPSSLSFKLPAWLLRAADAIPNTTALPTLLSDERLHDGLRATQKIVPKGSQNIAPPLSFLVDSVTQPLVSGLHKRQPHDSHTSEANMFAEEPTQLQTEEDDLKRGDGFIVGAAYSGPDFQPREPVAIGEPPLFAMQNVSILPPQARKPISSAYRQFTSQMQKAAVEYCTTNNLNCSEQHALQTAISVALRTSPAASMFRQISASLSAVEGAVASALRPLGWPGDQKAVPKPPPKPPVQTAEAVQFAFSLVGTSVALLRSFVRVTKSPQPLIPLDTQLHDHHRSILSNLLYSGRQTEGCSMIAPLKLASNCRSFIIEVPARTDNCVGSGLAQGGALTSLTVHGFELSCLSSLRCSQQYIAHEPYNLDGGYHLTSRLGSSLSFEKIIPTIDPLDRSSNMLYLYKSEEGKTASEILKSSHVAVSAIPHEDDVPGPFAYLPMSSFGFPPYQRNAPPECQNVDEFPFPYCLLHGVSHWRFTEVRPNSSRHKTKYFPAIVSFHADCGV